MEYYLELGLDSAAPAWARSEAQNDTEKGALQRAAWAATGLPWALAYNSSVVDDMTTLYIHSQSLPVRGRGLYTLYCTYRTSPAEPARPFQDAGRYRLNADNPRPWRWSPHTRSITATTLKIYADQAHPADQHYQQPEWIRALSMDHLPSDFITAGSDNSH